MFAFSPFPVVGSTVIQTGAFKMSSVCGDSCEMRFRRAQQSYSNKSNRTNSKGQGESRWLGLAQPNILGGKWYKN